MKNCHVNYFLRIIFSSRQTAKIRNAFANNMSTDIKLSKAKCLK